MEPYVFWNLHEPERTSLILVAIMTFTEFVRIAKEGLWVILRP